MVEAAAAQNVIILMAQASSLVQQWKCPFSFCPKFGTNLSGSSALRNHVFDHLKRSGNECLSGRGREELIQHLREHGRWLCGRCSKTYLMGSRCRGRECGASFSGSEELPIWMPPGWVLPGARDGATVLQERMELEVVHSAFRPFDDDPEVFRKLRDAAIPTLLFIPKSCRRGVARCYADAIKAVNEVPEDLNRWALMQIFMVSVLRSVGRAELGGISLAEVIKRRLAVWEGGTDGQRGMWQEALSWESPRVRGSSFSEEDQRKLNVKRCEKLAMLGRLGDAAAALVSDGVLPHSQEVLEELARKHPEAPPPEVPTLQPPSMVPSWEKVLRALQSFPRGSAGGRDGLRPQLLLDMVQGVAGRIEEAHVQGVFTAHVALLLRGGAPSFLAPFLMSAPIIPLAKPGGGVRPVAVGEVWRRLTSRVALGEVSIAARAFLLPFQLGVGVKGAAEAITHSLNHLVAKHSAEEDLGILKVDLSNAFNLVSREAFLEGVRQHFPSLSAWVDFCYGCQALLFVGDSTLLSCCGVQQGDPLGPLLFSIALQPLIRRIGEVCPNLLLNAWYLDDGVLMGCRKDLGESYRVIQECGPQLGLVVNQSKSLWWWPEGVGDRPPEVPVGIVVSNSSALCVLGNPISVEGRGADEVVGQRVRGIQDILAEVRKLDDPQLELLLLRACVGMPKMMYNLRSSPPDWIEGSIRSFDAAVHQSLVHIWNTGFTAEQRSLVGLPLKLGGLGIPMGSEVALSAAVASLVQAADLWEMLTGDVFSSSRCGILLDAWNSRFRPASPVGLDELRLKAKPQQWLSGLAAEVIRGEIRSRGGARVSRLVSAVSAPGSGIWTTAIPTPFSGLRMNPAAYRLALKYRTGHDVFEASRACTACRGLHTSDAAGDHDSHCPGGGRRIRRHNLLRDALFVFFREANQGPRLEVAGLLDGGAKPADILVPAWDGGRDLCVDVSIISPFVGGGSVLEPGDAARRAEEKKVSKYGASCSANGLIFEPFIMESLGGFGGRAEHLIRTVAARWAEAKGLEPPAALSLMRQKLSFVSQKALADGFLLRQDYI